jgi:hypothetical protein
MSAPRHSLAALLASSTLVLAACGVLPFGSQSPAPVVSGVGAGGTAPEAGADELNPKAHDVVLFALGLIETGYRFGGKNPEAGLDCSGMVSYVYEKSADMRLAGSAADLARQGKPVAATQLASRRPGLLQHPQQAPFARRHLHRRRPLRARAEQPRQGAYRKPQERLVRGALRGRADVLRLKADEIRRNSACAR